MLSSVMVPILDKNKLREKRESHLYKIIYKAERIKILLKKKVKEIEINWIKLGACEI